MAEKPYDPDQVSRAIDAFEAQQPGAVEALLASVQLMVKSLARFRADSVAFRERAGEERCRDFAMEEFNDLVYEIQDAGPVAIRIFNSLMRDTGAPKGPVDE